MILNTTYTDKSHKDIITDLIGKPYGFFEMIKLGGIGSKRMIIQDTSPNLKQYLNIVSDVNYANIEMRPNGILIYINKGLQNFIWIIPYYQLVIYKTKGYSIHAQGQFIQFKNSKTSHENKKFFKRLLKAKINNDKTLNFINV